MSMELWEKIVNEIAEKSPDSNIWPAVTGEGLVYGKKFIAMLEYASSNKLNIYWNTNAVLFKKDWIDRICAIPLREITIGLGATTSEVYVEFS